MNILRERAKTRLRQIFQRSVAAQRNKVTLEILKKDVTYTFSVFKPYLTVFPPEKIQGATICELGPGKNLGVALLFKCLGANTVYVMDKYLQPWDKTYHPAFYKLLSKELKKHFPESDPSPLLSAAEGHSISGMHICAEDAEHLTVIPENSLDFCCSWAVLEHLYDPATAFARLGKVTRPGGLGLHQVDFRDHLNFLRPLEFLLKYFRWNETYDESLIPWLSERLHIPQENLQRDGIDVNDLILRQCAWYGNSFRRQEYDVLWRNSGFYILDYECNLWADEEYLNDFLSRISELREIHFSRKELAEIGGRYLVQKQVDI